MTTSLDSEFAERSESIVAQFGFRNLKSFIKNQALLMLMAKIEKHEAESKHFEAKYNMPYEKFRAKIESLENDEIFEEEDDLLDWRFANEAVIRLLRQKQELENA